MTGTIEEIERIELVEDQVTFTSTTKKTIMVTRQQLIEIAQSAPEVRGILLLIKLSNDFEFEMTKPFREVFLTALAGATKAKWHFAPCDTCGRKKRQ